MQYITMGQSGLTVSRVCLGAMLFGTMPDPYRHLGKIDRKEASEMVERALAAGANFIDTADAYTGGQSEQMLGEILGERRDEVVISTKVGFRTGAGIHDGGLSRRHIIAACDASLRRLGTDYIDLYIAHRQDVATPLEETLSTFDELVRAGKVRYLGLSNWAAWRASAALQMQKDNGWAPFVCGQYYYSLLSRDVERELIPLMRHFGVGLMVWSPLAYGFLSGKYTRESLADKENRLSALDLPFDKEEGFALVERIRAIAARQGASVAQVSIAWLLAKQDVCSVILGAGKFSQLEDNLGAMDVELSTEEIAELDMATERPAPYPQWHIDVWANM